MPSFVKYELTAETLCIGERIKGGLLRPCSRVLRYSLVTGALQEMFGKGIHAVGGFLKEEDGFNRMEIMTYSPRDRVLSISKIPLQIEFLSNIKGEIYIDENSVKEKNIPNSFELIMGGMRFKGFGRCKLQKSETKPDMVVGSKPATLKTRIPLGTKAYSFNEEELSKLKEEGKPTEFLERVFGIRKVIKPVFGYLFEPDEKRESGRYVLSLFEKSVIVGPKFLTEEQI